MKTSVIEVHDMLSVWNVDEAEKRIGEVPGVKSVTVNYEAGNATVRYDETRLEVADIKSAVRQRGFETAAHAADSGHEGHEVHAAPGAPGAPPATPSPAPMPAVKKATQDAVAATPAHGNKQADKTDDAAQADISGAR